MTRDKGDLIAGAVVAAFGIYVIWIASGLPYVSDVGPGPGFFPLWLGIGLVLFAGTLMAKSVTARNIETRANAQSWKSSGRALGGWFAVMIAIALLGRMGFALTFVLLTIFLIVALDRRPLPLAVLVGVGLAAAFHVLFVLALDVSLPKAVWGF